MWKDIGYIMASQYREEVFKKLSRKNFIPSNLCEETNIKFSHLSRTLKELKEKDLVKCLNEDSKKGRIYALTKYGKKVWMIMKEKI